MVHVGAEYKGFAGTCLGKDALTHVLLMTQSMIEKNDTTQKVFHGNTAVLEACVHCRSA